MTSLISAARPRFQRIDVWPDWKHVVAVDVRLNLAEEVLLAGRAGAGIDQKLHRRVVGLGKAGADGVAGTRGELDRVGEVVEALRKRHVGRLRIGQVERSPAGRVVESVGRLEVPGVGGGVALQVLELGDRRLGGLSAGEQDGERYGERGKQVAGHDLLSLFQW